MVTEFGKMSDMVIEDLNLDRFLFEDIQQIKTYQHLQLYP